MINQNDLQIHQYQLWRAFTQSGKGMEVSTYPSHGKVHPIPNTVFLYQKFSVPLVLLHWFSFVTLYQDSPPGMMFFLELYKEKKINIVHSNYRSYFTHIIILHVCFYTWCSVIITLLSVQICYDRPLDTHKKFHQVAW